jgi:hypothetical protein
MAPLRLFRLDLLAYAAARATVIQFWMTGAQNTTAYRRQLPFEDAAFEVVVNVEALTSTAMSGFSFERRTGCYAPEVHSCSPISARGGTPATSKCSCAR